VAEEEIMNIPVELLTPLLVAALGALWSEKAGVLNIALEGQLLAGALAAVLVQHFTGSAILAVGAALAVGALTGMVLAWGAFDLGTDPFIAALGLNLLLPAAAGWASSALFGNEGAIRVGAVAPVWFGAPAFLIAALALTIATHAVLFHTSWGLRLRAAGTSPPLMASRGLRAQTYQRQALIVSGALGSLAGAFLSLSLGVFVPGMSAGKGWIALVALYLGVRRPIFILLACLLLAWTEQTSNLLQGVEHLPSGVVLALPPLVTVVVFVITSAVRHGIQKRPRSVPNRR
jgi:simple sugar transport system permease protein